MYHKCNELVVLKVSESKSKISNPDKFLKLIKDLQDCIFMRHTQEVNSLKTLNFLNKDNTNAFGYEGENQYDEVGFSTFYRRKRLRHKLKRILKEIKFAKTNLKKYQTLTQREKEVIEFLAKGHNNREIAEKIFISRSTVEQHRKNINRKLEIKSFVDVIRYVYAYNIV